MCAPVAGYSPAGKENTMNINTALDELLSCAVEKLMLDELDVVYARNTALGIIGAQTYSSGTPDRVKAENGDRPTRRASQNVCSKRYLFVRAT